jgi:hypothetical protein
MASSITPTGSTTCSSPPPWEGENYEPRNPMESGDTYSTPHSRIEHMLFDGVLTPVHGALQPDLSRPGLGLAFKHADAARYAV